MRLASAFAIYFVIWWTVLFAVLPFGVERIEGEPAAGHDAGAPVHPHLIAKALVTTVLSAAIFAIGWWLIARGFVGLDRLPGLDVMPKPE